MLTRRQLIASGAALTGSATLRPATAQEAEELQINSARYVSMNADTGAIFAQRGAHDQVAIASLTKIFTAMEAINLAPLDTEILTTSDDMQSADATVMGFGPGETFTLEELIYGMLLPSGNDAAHAIARALGYRDGDTAEEAVQRFMDLVNERVQAMGLENTHLLNPDGWGVEGHYSSAADVAAFMAYASENDFLLEVMGTARYTTSAGYSLVNSNKVLSSSPSVLGGKTGYDWDSGWCLVQIAQRDRTRIVAVTLDGIAPDDWYNDNLVLLDYGFDQQTALGGTPFDGETMAWADPATVLFAQAGAADASLVGETTDREVIVTRQQPVALPERVETQTSFDGRRGSSVLAGAGATALVGAMAASRWLDHGGDRSMATIAPAGAAIRRSLTRAIPPLPIRRSAADEPAGDLPDLDEEAVAAPADVVHADVDRLDNPDEQA